MKITATKNISYMANSIMQKGQVISTNQLGEHLARLFESRGLATVDVDTKMNSEQPENKAVRTATNKSRAKNGSKRKTR